MNNISNITQFQSNDNFIECISVGENLRIFVRTWNEKRYSIIFNKYFRVNIDFNIPAEIGEIELIRETDWEQPDLRGLDLLKIRDPWDNEVIFSAYVGGYIVKDLQIKVNTHKVKFTDCS